MSKNNCRLLLWLLPMLLLPGAFRAAFAQAAPGASAALEGATWVLQNFGDPAKPTEVLAGTKITARFDGATDSLAGNAGCNQYFAGYTADAAKLTLGTVSSTKKLCPEPAGLMEQEQQYLALLATVTQYRVTDGRLELASADGQRVLRYVSAAALEGVTWVLQSYGDAQNPTSVLPRTVTTARFDGALHSVSGTAGCNQYIAGYRADAGDLAISAAGVTGKFCAEPAGLMQQEQQYLALLASVSQYNVVNGQLQLATADGRRVLRYVSPIALEGVTWVLQAYGSAQNPTPVMPGTEITAVVTGRALPNGTVGIITGTAGCNQYFAGYLAGAGNLRLTPIGSTWRFCGAPAGVMNQEQQYLALLSRVTQYRTTNDQLELTTADGAQLLRYTVRK
jgi:heat shock protein HslJ